KALANTHSLCALLGRSRLRSAAEAVFMSGTFWPSAAPMAAALANLQYLRSFDAVGRVMRLGTRLTEGLVRAGARFGIEVQTTGPPALPTITMGGDRDFVQVRRFASQMVARGSFVHPLHNWFVSTAHTESDIDETLGHAQEAFRALAEPGSARTG